MENVSSYITHGSHDFRSVCPGLKQFRIAVDAFAAAVLGDATTAGNRRREDVLFDELL